MLNTFKIGGNSTSVSFNSPSTGIIQKSHPKSRFTKFHHDSPLATEVFKRSGNYMEMKVEGKTWKENIPIVILQLMAFGDGEFICEFILSSDIKEDLTNPQQ